MLDFRNCVPFAVAEPCAVTSEEELDIALAHPMIRVIPEVCIVLDMSP